MPSREPGYSKTAVLQSTQPWTCHTVLKAVSIRDRNDKLFASTVAHSKACFNCYIRRNNVAADTELDEMWRQQPEITTSNVWCGNNMRLFKFSQKDNCFQVGGDRSKIVQHLCMWALCLPLQKYFVWDSNIAKKLILT
ncbi:hypothetical protein WJX77_004481 [Trebouxia sp. C0004]